MKTLIVSGGELNKDFLQAFISNNEMDYIIAVDKGLEILDSINILPNCILGDFDSIKNGILEKYNRQDIKIIKLNPEKDFSDTHMALKEAIEMKSTEIYILGALGKRMDHAIANIHILREALENNIECKIIDTNNIIKLITKGTEVVHKSKYKYISLFPLTTSVKGITLKGFKYPLTNDMLTIGHSIGVSNELLENIGTISISDGILIMVQSND